MQAVMDSMSVQFPTVTKKLLKDIIPALLDTITDVTVVDGRVAIKNHIFKKQSRAARKGRNPRTGASIEIPAKDIIAYKNTKAI